MPSWTSTAPALTKRASAFRELPAPDLITVPWLRKVPPVPPAPAPLIAPAETVQVAPALLVIWLSSAEHAEAGGLGRGAFVDDLLRARNLGSRDIEGAARRDRHGPRAREVAADQIEVLDRGVEGAAEAGVAALQDQMGDVGVA